MALATTPATVRMQRATVLTVIRVRILPFFQEDKIGSLGKKEDKAVIMFAENKMISTALEHLAYQSETFVPKQLARFELTFVGNPTTLRKQLGRFKR